MAVTFSDNWISLDELRAELRAAIAKRRVENLAAEMDVSTAYLRGIANGTIGFIGKRVAAHFGLEPHVVYRRKR